MAAALPKEDTEFANHNPISISLTTNGLEMLTRSTGLSPSLKACRRPLKALNMVLIQN